MMDTMAAVDRPSENGESEMTIRYLSEVSCGSLNWADWLATGSCKALLCIEILQMLSNLHFVSGVNGNTHETNIKPL